MSESNLTLITIKWSDVKCIERNSNITGYVIKLNQRTVKIVSSDTREFTVVELFPSTEYTIGIAAMSMNGTGLFQLINSSTSSPTGNNASLECHTSNILCNKNCRNWASSAWQTFAQQQCS